MHQGCAVAEAEWIHLSKDVGECATPVNGKSHVPLRHSENPGGSYILLMDLLSSRWSKTMFCRAPVNRERQNCR